MYNIVLSVVHKFVNFYVKAVFMGELSVLTTIPTNVQRTQLNSDTHGASRQAFPLPRMLVLLMCARYRHICILSHSNNIYFDKTMFQVSK